MGGRRVESRGDDGADDPPLSTSDIRAVYGQDIDLGGMSFAQRRTALLIHLALASSRCDDETTRLVHRYLGDTDVIPLLTALRRERAFTFSHCLRTMKFAALIAGGLDIDVRERSALCVGALLHDVGKLAVPASILLLPRQLRPIELEKVRTHPERGRESVGDKRISGWDAVLDIVRHHHEYLDGSGYPLGLSASGISWRTRCVTVADIFSALTENRPYRAALSSSAALRILGEMAGAGKLDRDVVDTLRSGLVEVGR